jgi:DNA-binding CsgD family transcriptional regulator
MSARSAAQGGRARELLSLLGELPPDPTALPEFMTAFRQVMSSELAIYYQPQLSEAHWDIGHAVGTTVDGGGHALVQRLKALVRAFSASASSFGAYEPFNAEVTQRNRPMTLKALATQEQYVPAHVTKVYGGLQLQAHDQLRMLLCDGQRVLGYIAAVRHDPFGRSEERLMQALARPLLNWTKITRNADGDDDRVEVLMDALPAPAFIVRHDGCIEHVNERGLALLARSREATLNALQSARRGNGPPGTYAVKLDRSRPRSAVLVQLSVDQTARRVVESASAWQATPKQLRILELLAEGKSNKEIAVSLQCAEVTIESHLTRLYRRIGVGSRTELLSRLLAAPHR